jgi:membrane protein implicated in regulation of membrane protease activity
MESLLRRGALWVAALLIAFIFVVLAAAFLCGAIYFALATSLPPAAAALATAGVALVVALLIVLIAWAVSSVMASSGRHALARPERTADQQRGDRQRGGRRRPGPLEDQLAAELGSIIGREFTGFAKKHAFGAALASLGAGFAVGASPKLRGFLMGLLKL